jgi:hypothetical protein
VLGRKGPLRRATTRRALAPCAPLRAQADLRRAASMRGPSRDSLMSDNVAMWRDWFPVRCAPWPVRVLTTPVGDALSYLRV